MLTIGELLHSLDLRLLAGEAALEVPVRWVHISELEDPTPWMSGGELLLTTGLQLNTAKRQRAFVDRLADHHLARLRRSLHAERRRDGAAGALQVVGAGVE